MSKMLAGFSTAPGSHLPVRLRDGGKGAPSSALVGWALAGGRARLRAAMHPSAAASPAPACGHGGDVTGGTREAPDLGHWLFQGAHNSGRGASITSPAAEGWHR